MLWSSVSDVAALATYGSFLRKKTQFYKIIASVFTVQSHSKLGDHAYGTMVLTHADKGGYFDTLSQDCGSHACLPCRKI